MPFASDTFTDSSGTNLSSHTPSGGGSWTKHASYAQDILISDANRARGNSFNDTAYYHSADPATAEYDVEAVVWAESNAGQAGVAGRIATGANTMYLARFRSSNGWELVKISAGTSTVLGTYSGGGTSLTVDTNYALKLEIRDAAKKLYVDGTERVSSSDNAITAAGQAGVRNNTGSNTTGYHLDDWSATDASTDVPKSATDSGTLTETASLAITASIADTGAGTETAAVAAALAATESGAGTEGTPAIEVPATDAGTLAEVASSAAELAASDSAALAEALELAAAVGATDSGAGADGSSLDTGSEVAKSGADSGVLSEAAAIAVTLAGSDTGAVTDGAGAVAAAVAAAETGILAEVAALLASLAASEAGALSDASSLDTGAAAIVLPLSGAISGGSPVASLSGGGPTATI